MDKNASDTVKAGCAGCAGWLLAAFCIGVYFENVASEERDRVQAELESKGEAPGWVARTFGGRDPAGDAYKRVQSSGIKWFFIAGAVSFYVAFAVKKGKLREQVRKSQEEAERADTIAREIQMRIDRESKDEDVARSKKAIIASLGMIDQTLLAFPTEADSGRRVMVVQVAQEALSSLESKVLSGQILSEALNDVRIRAHAGETLADAERLGHATDRLSREIKRLFDLGVSDAVPTSDRRAENVSGGSDLVDWMLNQSGESEE